LTVTLAGANLKLLIFTALELPPDAACVDDPLEVADPLGLLPPPQPANRRAVPAMTSSELMECRGFTAMSVRSGRSRAEPHRTYERRRVAQSENTYA
jgi:hypothetical protein